jgi:hypothetical protein
MMRLGNILISLLAVQTYAYGAIPPPPQDEETPDTAVSEDVNQDVPDQETPDQDDVVIDAPEGRPSTDKTSPNKPPMDWYKDMYKQLYDMQQHAQHMQKGYYSHELTYYASYLYYVLDKLYASTYVSYGQPKQYAWGYPTRGDFNHVYYYWIRPLYKKMVYHSAHYYNSLDPYYYPSYKQNFYPMYDGYHSLTRCMFGQNGNDPKAEDDTEWTKLEASAGFRSK